MRTASRSAALVTIMTLGVVLGMSVVAANASVLIKGFAFEPASVTVNVGDTVTWTNDDGVSHSATADDSSWDTGVFVSGTRMLTFAKAGTFAYHCSVHPAFMRGTVTVAGPATPTPAPTTAPPPTAPPPTPAPPLPTVAPTAKPTAPPSVAPPTPTAAPTVPATPSPIPPTTPAASATPAPSTALLATDTARPSATATSRSGEGVDLLIPISALLGVGVLIGAILLVARRR